MHGILISAVGLCKHITVHYTWEFQLLCAVMIILAILS
jgi:hypothetical protein